MNLNKVFIVGRLTADPQLRSTPGGQSVCSFSLATNRNWTDKNGERKEEVQFHNIVAWGRQAEIAGQFLKKGGSALVEGRLQTRSWQDKQGVERKTTEIVCERLQLGPRPGGGEIRPQGSAFTDKSSVNLKSPVASDVSVPEINLDEEEIRPEDIPF